MDFDGLIRRFENRDAVIGVLGLGYVGLPLAVLFTSRGFRVIGLDSDRDKIESLSEGRSYIGHIPGDSIRDALDRGFSPTTDFAEAGKCDAILVCVPTPLTAHREPDLTYVVRSSRAIATTLRKGQVVVLESTTYPGTTREVVTPILEESGLKVDRDFVLGYSPEREDPNNAEFDTSTIPKVVGADSPDSLAVLKALYGQVVKKVVPVRSTRVAEASKILENTFRAVNIALVNELKVVFTEMGIDVWEVIEAAATKPFGFMRFNPGPGLGGHCIPIDPFYLSWKAREYDVASRFIETAGEVNTHMPHWVVQRTMEAFSSMGKGLSGARILIVGLAYKKNVDDARSSPSFKLMALLEARGASVDYHDPYIPVVPRLREHPHLYGRKSVSIERCGDYDAVVIATDHDCIDWGLLLDRSRLVIDTRGVYREDHDKVVKA